MSQIELLNVRLNVPEGYSKSSDKRVISVESDKGILSEINLDNDKEPTIKTSNNKIITKGSKVNVVLEDTAKSISTLEKYSNGTNEYSFLVRKYVNPKQACRGLTHEVNKYTNVMKDPESSGYKSRSEDGKEILCYVQNEALVIASTDDPIGTINVFQKSANTWGTLKIGFGAALILITIFFFIMGGFDYRFLLIIAIAAYFISAGRIQNSTKENDCPKIQTK